MAALSATCKSRPFDTSSVTQDNFLLGMISTMPADNDLKKMMREIGSTLVHAIAASSKTADSVRRIRHQGCSLYLVLDHDEGGNGARIELTAGHASSTKPDFLLNKGDVSFLESVGIDATRPGRRR